MTGITGVTTAASELDFFAFSKAFYRRTNCNIYNSTTEVCTECSDGYYLTKSRCCKNNEYPF